MLIGDALGPAMNFPVEPWILAAETPWRCGRSRATRDGSVHAQRPAPSPTASFPSELTLAK